MKQSVSPAVAAVIIVVVVAIVAVLGFRALRSPAGSAAGDKPPGMPPDVAAEFNRRMGGPTGAAVPKNTAPNSPAMPTGPGPGPAPAPGPAPR